MFWYEVNGRKVETVSEVMRLVEDYVTFDDEFDEYLDELYGDIEICGYTYNASLAFHRVDEVAYRCMRSDLLDSMLSDFESTVERLDEDESADFYDVTVEYCTDESEYSEACDQLEILYDLGLDDTAYEYYKEHLYLLHDEDPNAVYTSYENIITDAKNTLEENRRDEEEEE